MILIGWTRPACDCCGALKLLTAQGDRLIWTCPQCPQLIYENAEATE